MTLHLEYLSLEQISLRRIKKHLKFSTKLSFLASMNKYVKNKREGYAEDNNKEKAGEYFILNYKIMKKMKELPFVGMR